MTDLEIEIDRDELIEELSKDCIVFPRDILSDYFEHVNGSGIPKQAVLTESYIMRMNNHARLQALKIWREEQKNKRLLESNAFLEKNMNEAIWRNTMNEQELIRNRSKIHGLTVSNEKYRGLLLFNLALRNKQELLIGKIRKQSSDLQFENRMLKNTLRKKEKLFRNVDAQLKSAIKDNEFQQKTIRQLSKRLKELKKNHER